MLKVYAVGIVRGPLVHPDQGDQRRCQRERRAGGEDWAQREHRHELQGQAFTPVRQGANGPEQGD